MRLIFLLLATACFAASQLDPVDQNVGARSIVLSPSDGETGVSRNVTIKFHLLNNSLALCPTLSLSDVYATFADVECISDTIYSDLGIGQYYDDEKFSVTLDCDTLEIQRITSLLPYTRYNVTCQWIWIFNGEVEHGGDSVYFDTLSFITEPTVLGFRPIRQFKAFASSSDTTTLQFSHPLGTYIYGLDPDSNSLTVYTPEEDYDDERTTRLVSYVVDGIPEGQSSWYFWSEADGDTSAHYKVTIHRSVLTNGRARGVITR